MCLGVPGQIVDILDADNGIAEAEVGGVRRTVSLGVLPADDPAAVGDWVLIHLGFAMAKIDEREADEAYGFLEDLGGELDGGGDAFWKRRIE